MHLSFRRQGPLQRQELNILVTPLVICIQLVCSFRAKNSQSKQGTKRQLVCSKDCKTSNQVYLQKYSTRYFSGRSGARDVQRSVFEDATPTEYICKIKMCWGVIRGCKNIQSCIFARSGGLSLCPDVQKKYPTGDLQDQRCAVGVPRVQK
jgi:hypothetical protein